MNTDGRRRGGSRFDINQALRKDNVASKYGAPMGRPNRVSPLGVPKLYVQKVKFHDGDYDAGGAYWGGVPALPLYCGMTEDGEIRIFVRARSRAAAYRSILKTLEETPT